MHKSILVKNGSNSYDAVKKIKDLQKYNAKNEFVMNAILNCCKAKQFKKPKMINGANHKKNIHSINAMMKCFISNNENKKAIVLFEAMHMSACDDLSLILFLKACNNHKEYTKGKQMINARINKDLNRHRIELVNTLIHFHGKSGNSDGALRIFNDIPQSKKNVVSITNMMAVYNSNKEYHKCMLLYEHTPIRHDYVSNILYLKACADSGTICAYQKGTHLIRSVLAAKDIRSHSIQFTNAIIDFYGKTGDVNEASNVFQNVPNHKMNIISVTSLMKCFIQNSMSNKAILLYEQYSNSDQSIVCDDVSNILFLKACANMCDYEKGKKRMDLILEKDINSHSIEFINTLMIFYGKSGDMHRALHIFNGISHKKRSVCGVNAIMKCLIQNNENESAVSVYETYHSQCNDISHLLFIKACDNVGDYDKAKQLIQSLSKGDIHSHSTELITTVIDFYAKNGDINSAKHIFKAVKQQKNASIKNAMMKAYNNNEEYRQCIAVYEDKHNCNDISHILYIKACVNLCDYDKAKQLIHSLIKDDISNIESHSIEFITTLIAFYGETGDIQNVSNVLNHMPQNRKNRVCINAAMKAYNRNTEYEQSIVLYEQSHTIKCEPDNVSNMLFIKACANLGEFAKGQRLIDSQMQNGDTHSIEFVTSLIDFYGQTGDVKNALHIFDNISEHRKDMVTVSSLMAAYNKNEEYRKCIALFEECKGRHTDVSKMLFLKACANIGDYEKGKQLIQGIDNCNVHAHNINIEFITALIDFYGEIGDLRSAVSLFEDIPRKNMVCIGAMMNAYNKNEGHNETIALFHDCSTRQLCMDEYMYCMALIAAANLVSLHKGSLIINDLNRAQNSHILQSSLFVQSAIITLYAKCSEFDKAIHTFESVKHEHRNGVLHLYAAVMDCYAKQGEITALLSLFAALKKDDKICLTNTIYCIVLNGCAHSGLADEALLIFEEIRAKHKRKSNISPKIITALIDCLGRKGNAYLNLAENVYKTYMEPNANVYYKFKLNSLLSLLSSCRMHNDITRAQRVSQRIETILNIDNKDQSEIAAMYISLSSIYGQNKQFDKVNEITQIRKKKGVY